MIERVDLVLFEIAGTLYGADMTQVRRIARITDAVSVGAPLGPPTQGHRSLVFGRPGERREYQLPIDAVLRVESAHRDDLRRLPPGAGPSSFIIGAWLLDDQPVLLVDLHATTPSLPEAPHV